MHRHESSPRLRGQLFRLTGGRRRPRALERVSLESLERRYTPTYPVSIAHFTQSDSTFTLDNDLLISPGQPWVQQDISYSSSGDSASQLIIDGNGKTITIADPNFSGLFLTGNTYVGTSKPTILKNFTIVSSVDIASTLGKITGAVQFQNCHIIVTGNILANGGGLAYNDGPGASGLHVSVTNSSAQVYGKVGSNAGPLIGYVGQNSGNVYTISNCSTAVSDSNSLSGLTLGSGAGAFVGSGISNTASISNSYALFNGSMSNGSGIVGGKFLGSSGTLTIDKFYAVTNITYVAPSNPSDGSQNAYGMSSYFGGSLPNSFALSNVNVLNLGADLPYVYCGTPTVYSSLSGYSRFASYGGFAAAANTPSARIGNTAYVINVENGGSSSAEVFYTTADTRIDWDLDLGADTLVALPATTTSVQTSPNPSVLGESVTLTATVSSQGGAVSGGSVEFFDNASSLGQAAVVSGVATLAASALTAGTAHSITASYSGRGLLSGSTSSAVSQTVNPFGTASLVAVMTPAAGAKNGAAFTTQPVVAICDAFGNTVADSTAAVTMTVSAGATTVGTATVNAVNGVATFTDVGIRGVAGTQYTLTYAAAGLAPQTQVITPTTTTFTVSSLADNGGSGTLRWAIMQANTVAGDDVIAFAQSLGGVITLASVLPAITQPVAVNGPGQSVLAIAGGGRITDGITFVAGSAGSSLQGLSLRGFRNFGIRLENSPGVTIANVSVTGTNAATSMGLYATGNLSGTTIETSLFTGGRRGALLVNAHDLTFGTIGRGNTISNHRYTARSAIGTGIRAEGDLTGTIVAGNTFVGNNRGFAFVAAANLRLENNLFIRNRIAAVYVQGDNTTSSMAGNTFGTGGQRNGRIFQRIAGSQGV